jgi:hypothetical protein
MSGSSAARYRVVRSEKVRDQLRQWAETAKQTGLIGRYIEALRIIEEKLESAPLAWGDPLYRLPHLNLLLCRGIYWIFLVEYGVDESKRLVVIKEYKLVPGHPLEPRP